MRCAARQERRRRRWRRLLQRRPRLDAGGRLLPWRGFDTLWQFAATEEPDEPEEASRAPTAVRVESRAQSLMVTWRAAAGATSYRVQWRRQGQAWSPERQAAETSYELGGLASRVYEVRVLAVVDGEVGEASETTRVEVEAQNRRPEAQGLADSALGLWAVAPRVSQGKADVAECAWSAAPSRRLRQQTT